MKYIYLITLLFFSSIISAQTMPDLSFNQYASGFNDPVSIANAGDNRLFIVEQAGRIKIIDQGIVQTTPFLNITSIVNDSQSEQGLLGLAFHPNYASNGYFYVYYTSNVSTGSTGKQTTISRFNVSSTNANIADPNSEVVILTIDQPYWNHNGGCIAFGPDNYLYIGMGDGGSGGDPDNYAQNTQSLLGKMLRIDIDNGNPYSIPSDNPFLGSINTLEEIWSIGLRNPWRFSFDSQTGDMWIGDVGQNAWEEISYEEAGSGGGRNYGWRCYEGFAPYNPNGCNGNYTDPVHVYVNDGFGGSSGCSVTGGYVYRGNQYPNLVGHYIFADYCSGKFYTIYDNMGGAGWTTTTQPNTNYYVSAFGEDVNGELYFSDLGSGRIYSIIDNSVVPSNIEEHKENFSFPNPIKAGTKISLNKAYNNINISDTNGRIVWNTKSSEKLIIPNNIANGIYFVKIDDFNPVKIIINND